MTIANALQVQAFHTTDVTEQVRATLGGSSSTGRCHRGISAVSCVAWGSMAWRCTKSGSTPGWSSFPCANGFAGVLLRPQREQPVPAERTKPQYLDHTGELPGGGGRVRPGLPGPPWAGPAAPGRVVHGAAGQRPECTVRQLAERNADPVGRGRLPAAGQALAEQLLEDCLFILDNACQRLQGVALGRRDEERAIMRRVSEWAADCPEETLNLVELAEVAGVSLRQLQQAFKAFTGMPPAHWLRLRRLNGARRDLLRGGGVTVAEVAMRWSFWHLGRFSESYRQLFKEFPSETLKRGRG